MDYRRYERLKSKLLADSSICKENRALFKKFFVEKEYKLKRQNGNKTLDNSSCDTVYKYVIQVRNINTWFKNKPLKEITKKDIKRVYDQLEEGEIHSKTSKKPLVHREDYYTKHFRGELFRLAGKDVLAKDVLKFHKRKREEEVRFIPEKEFRKVVDIIIQPKQKALAWVAWDYGENINALLQLRKKDFVKQTNDSGEEEYRVNFREEILKRSRNPRSELSNYQETAQYLDIILRDLKEDELVWNFGYAMAKKFLKRAVRLANARCIPKGQEVTWKDLRSSMACHLLKEGWTLTEVNSRLGHKPSSDVIDRYVNFLALDRHAPKKKLYNNSLQKLQGQLETLQQENTLLKRRTERIEGETKYAQEVAMELFKKNEKLLLKQVKEIVRKKA